MSAFSLLAANREVVFLCPDLEEVVATLREHHISFHAVFSSPMTISTIITQENRFRPWVQQAFVLNQVAEDLGVAKGVRPHLLLWRASCHVWCQMS